MVDLTERHEAIRNAMRLFNTDHLSEGLKGVSIPFGDLAAKMVNMLPDDPILRDFLYKLWEAKNLAVVLAAIDDESATNGPND